MKLFKSSTFQFLLGIMLIGLVGVYLGGITFIFWYEKAIEAAMVYVVKEVASKGAAAYRDRV